MTSEQDTGTSNETVYLGTEDVLRAQLAAAQSRISGLERQVQATAENERATLDQLIRVTGERDAAHARIETLTAALVGMVEGECLEACSSHHGAECHCWYERARVALDGASEANE